MIGCSTAALDVADTLGGMSREARTNALLDEASLSSDPATLHRVIHELHQTVDELKQRNAHLQHQLAQLQRRHYGPRSERMAAEQPMLFENDDANAWSEPEPASKPVQVPAHQRRRNGRRKIPDDLPRHRIEHELTEQERACPCCGEVRQRIGEEVSEQLEYEPASLYVLQHVRGKYACRSCEGEVETATKPRQPIEKGLAGPGLLAQVIVSKYCDHQPLHRLEKIFKRHGVHIPRSTKCDWCAGGAEQIVPIYERMKALILQSHVVQTDDTPVQVLQPGRGKTKTGRLWVYRGDRDHPFTVFDYTQDRSRDGPTRWLRSFTGYLQADAYAGYDRLFEQGTEAGEVIEVACWAHSRRKFYDARLTSPGEAHQAMAWIRQLYDIERRAEDLDDQPRRELRQREARPILDELGQWMQQQQAKLRPKSPIGEAVRYALSNWTALNRYVDDGRLSIDNSASERDIRPIAVGRHNWQFAGSDTGGRTAAILFSIIRSCERNDVEPYAYLRDVLARLPDHPANQLDDLLPRRWQPRDTNA